MHVCSLITFEREERLSPNFQGSSVVTRNGYKRKIIVGS